MKGDKIDIKKMAEHVLNPKKKYFIDNHIMHVEREWFFVVLIGLVILVLGGLWSLYLYKEYDTVSVLDFSDDTDKIVYRENMVSEVLGYYSKREEAYNALIQKAEKEGYEAFLPEVLTEEGGVSLGEDGLLYEGDSLVITGDMFATSTDSEGVEDVVE